MYFITVSNGILDKPHRQKIGIALWTFLWCIDKITRIDEKGDGIVLGGKPIQLKEVKTETRIGASRCLKRLANAGYLELKYAPYGIIIKVKKAKKRFNRIVEPTPRGLTKVLRGSTKMINVIKTVSNDNTSKETRNMKRNPPQPKRLTQKISERESTDAYDVLDAFSVVADAELLQRQPWQYDAAIRLNEKYGKDAVLEKIKQLRTTNRVKFLPRIYTPCELEEKWKKLEDAVDDAKGKVIDIKKSKARKFV